MRNSIGEEHIDKNKEADKIDENLQELRDKTLSNAEKRREKRMSAEKKSNIFGDILNVIWVIAITIGILFIGKNMVIRSSDVDIASQGGLFGYSPVVVVSGSMLPEIEINSISILKYCKLDEAELNDVVMYRHPELGINIIHRVIEKGTDLHGDTYVITKGDANEAADSIKVTNDIMIGKVRQTFNETVPFVTALMDENGEVDRTALAALILIIAVILSLIGTLIMSLVSEIKTIWLTITHEADNLVLDHNYELEGLNDEIRRLYTINRGILDSGMGLFTRLRLVRNLRKLNSITRDITNILKASKSKKG